MLETTIINFVRKMRRVFADGPIRLLRRSPARSLTYTTRLTTAQRQLRHLTFSTAVSSTRRKKTDMLLVKGVINCIL